MELTDKQKIFCQEYIVDFNATQAAIRAGYSEDSAKQIASENLSKLDLQTEINKLIDNRKNRLEVKQDRVIYELAKIAFSDLTNYISEDGVIDFTLINDSQSSVIKEFDEVTTEIVNNKNGYESTKTHKKIKLHDKLKALEMLSKHLGIYEDSEKPKPVININTDMSAEDAMKLYNDMIKDVK